MSKKILALLVVLLVVAILTLSAKKAISNYMDQKQQELIDQLTAMPNYDTRLAFAG